MMKSRDWAAIRDLARDASRLADRAWSPDATLRR
jgi:hypothetical protein